MRSSARRAGLGRAGLVSPAGPAVMLVGRTARLVSPAVVAVMRVGRRAGLVSPVIVVVVLALAAAACSRDKLASAEAQHLIESSPRFTAPDVLRVRARYCSTIDAPADNPAS